MSKNKEQSCSVLPCIANLLTLIFCCLRACDVIHWQWWSVMLPLLIYEGIAIGVRVILLILRLIQGDSP